VSTHQRFTFTYGRMEARMWLPPGGDRGVWNWPTFWAVGSSWPTDGEIDVMEGSGGKACWHFHAVNTDPGGCVRLSPQSGWHTFAADWRRDRIDYYYDDRLVGSVTSGVTGAPMFLNFNHGVYSNQTAHVPAEVLVDWVRVEANVDTR
jgi:beta-glucanase (GH16 family)